MHYSNCAGVNYGVPLDIMPAGLTHVHINTVSAPKCQTKMSELYHKHSYQNMAVITLDLHTDKQSNQYYK